MKRALPIIFLLTALTGFGQELPFKLITKNGDTLKFGLHYSKKNDFIYSTKVPTERQLKVLPFAIGRIIKKKDEKRLPINTIEKLFITSKFRFHKGQRRYNNLDGKEDVVTTIAKKYVKVKKKFELMNVIVEGDCSLYVNNDPKGYKFYVKRKNEETATEIQASTALGSRFKKVGKNYFKDCDQVQKTLLDSKYKTKLKFLYDKLKEITLTYNKSCS